ncbi:hypothetical protein D9613_003370 [Agrocybe pediades]|uniref:Reverse transcriptase domain-containing protein n=1 Tax=Agrocybe pediades TaxID=84607 RepID=A0A8H4VLT1_9AGAR|nr:hypothetical protein D9613_003370 [Agrocybe pediades]
MHQEDDDVATMGRGLNPTATGVPPEEGIVAEGQRSTRAHPEGEQLPDQGNQAQRSVGAAEPNDRCAYQDRHRNNEPELIGQGGDRDQNRDHHEEPEPLIERNERQQQANSNKKNSKAAVKLASMNINGFNAARAEHSETGGKWNNVRAIMHEKRIGILLVQEAHLDGDRERTLQTLFERQLQIWNFPDPEMPRARAGVAFVINKQIINASNVGEVRSIVPGRAASIKLTINTGKSMTILNVYAPNQAGDNRNFWQQLANYYAQHPSHKPDVMAGDLNMVEDSIDRLPMRMSDPQATVDALDYLKTELGLIDGWRNTYPTEKNWTYRQLTAHGSKSRIDRIYVTNHIFQSAFEWRIEPCYISDHQIVLVKLTDEQAPESGTGRRTLTSYLLKDAMLLEHIRKMGLELEEKFRNLADGTEQRTEENNVQILLAQYKIEVMGMAARREKAIIPRALAQLKTLEEQLAAANNDDTLPQAEKIQRTNDLLRQIEQIMRQQRNRQKKKIAATNRLLSETISREWSTMNKQKQPRDLIMALKRQGPENIQPRNNLQAPREKNSKKMTQMMRDYHHGLQREGLITDPIEEQQRNLKINEVLNVAVDKLDDNQKGILGQRISRDEVVEALKVAAHWKAPGVDGIPYELWKQMARRFVERRDQERQQDNGVNQGGDGRMNGQPQEGNEQENANADDAERPLEEIAEEDPRGDKDPQPDIIAILTTVFNDIEEHGVDKSTKFSRGWMCPLYKKKDKDEMANYRPLTMLNTDYKLMTKVYATRLSSVATTVLHENQAGFVKGRQITDQTRLIETMIDYAATTGKNGLIVGLDQEKAYDKIAHDYLWKALHKFGIPQEMINTIRSLYEKADTRVMVNGFLSDTYNIVRGVRQGDPLSCLLFDIAIEPLAIMLRTSPSLAGYTIKGVTEKVIVNLFADDTTVFLAAEDSFQDLQTILKNWCTASTAKFNIDKTEVIPIGTQEYRLAVLATRKTNPNSEAIQANLHIVPDGEAVRMLGAWVGNKVNATEVWAPVLEKVDKKLAQWAKSKPTIEGRRLIVQMIVGGMTQYLSKVQSMPKEVEKRLDRRIRKYIWSEKNSTPVKMDTVHAPIEIGGRAVLDIKARNEAINIMWLQSYLRNAEKRPLWAWVADGVLAGNVPKNNAPFPHEARLNMITQTWKPYKSKKAPASIRGLLATAVKYGLRPEALHVSDNVLREMPIWRHTEMKITEQRLATTKTGKCLIQKHHAVKLGDVEQIAGMANAHGHVDNKDCGCQNCQNTRLNSQCVAPNRCMKTAQKAVTAINEKWRPCPNWAPINAQQVVQGDGAEGGKIKMVDKSLPEVQQMEGIYRIFTSGVTHPRRPRIRDNVRDGEEGKIVVKTATTSQVQNGTPITTVAIVYKVNNVQKERVVRLPRKLAKLTESGSLVAIRLALNMAPRKATLEIEVPSISVFNRLTKTAKEDESRGYLGVQNAPLIKAILAQIRGRKGHTLLRSGMRLQESEEQNRAEQLAKDAQQNVVTDVISLKTSPSRKLTGAELALLTQKDAYRHIRSKKQQKYEHRKRTAENISQVQREIENAFRISVKEEQIWKAVRHKDHSRNIRYFLWMTLHDAYMVGTNWQRATYAPELQNRGNCTMCNKTESMQHILFECRSNGQEKIWQMAKQLWDRRTEAEEWPAPSLGTVVASALPNLPLQRDKSPTKGLLRFYRVLMAEAVYSIWKLRCERIIQNEDRQHSQNEVQSKFEHALQTRLELDVAMTHQRYEKRALPRGLVRDTWNNAVQVNRIKVPLPKKWPGKGQMGVLVSIGLGGHEERRRGIG